MMRKLVETAVAAVTEGDQEEKEAALRCIEVRICYLGSQVMPDVNSVRDLSEFTEHPATAEDVGSLLQSLAALRAAAAAPGTSLELSVFLIAWLPLRVLYRGSAFCRHQGMSCRRWKLNAAPCS